MLWYMYNAAFLLQGNIVPIIVNTLLATSITEKKIAVTTEQ